MSIYARYLIAAMCMCLPSCVQPKQPATTHPQEVAASDLTDGNVQIIGRLNKPYGEITRVRGIWHHNSPEVSKEDGAFSLGIVNIDGRDLFGPDQILIPGIFISNWNEDDDRMPIEDGDVFEGPVFESGRYVRAPLEVYKIVGQEDKLARADVFSFGFYSFLYLIRNEAKTSK